MILRIRSFLKKHWQLFLAWTKRKRIRRNHAVLGESSGLCPKINKHITTQSSSAVLKPIQLQAGLSIGAECSSYPHVWRWNLWRVQPILVGTLRRTGTEKLCPLCLLKEALKLWQINTFVPYSTAVYWSFDFFQRHMALNKRISKEHKI